MSEQSSQNVLRPLLPRPGDSPLPPGPQPPPSGSKRSTVVAACELCRQRKVKCDANRPSCSTCSLANKQCTYTTDPSETRNSSLKRKYTRLEQQFDKIKDSHENLQNIFNAIRSQSEADATAIFRKIRRGDDIESIGTTLGRGSPNKRGRAETHGEIIELLKNLPEKEAHDVLRRVRSGMDVATIVNQVKAGDLLLQLAVQPETRFRYEFPYRSEMPKEYFENNPYLDSIIYEVTSAYSPTQYSRLSEHSTSGLASNLAFIEYQSLYLKPFHAAQALDPQLSNAKPSLWTAVCDDDMLMRDLLSTFFRCEYHFTAAFQKDYFLDDMIAQRKDFCSSLLVNTLLAYSCVCYPRFSNRAEYWNPSTLLYRFLAEAKRIWELEATEARITTVQAGMLFNVFHNLCGLDEIGQAYRIQAIALAHKLRLFEDFIDEPDDRIKRGRAFTAWSLYNWETLVGFSFMFAPLLAKPPSQPLPDPSEDADWYGEIWIKYPLDQRLSPSYFGYTFRARSQFRVIMNEFCQAAYSESLLVDLGRANGLYSQLRSWYNALPELLQPKKIVLPGHLQLHMYYHNLILTIYEPLLETETNQEPSPSQIVVEARKNIETLVRIYYLRHGFDAMDLFIVIPLMLAGFNCIDAIDEQTPAPKLESLRSTLMLVAKGVYCQRRNHYLAEALFRVLRGRMRPQEAALLKDTIDPDEDEPERKQAMMQTVRSHWPVSIVRKKEDLDSLVLKNLVENYAHLNVEENSAATQAFEGVHM